MGLTKKILFIAVPISLALTSGCIYHPQKNNLHEDWRNDVAPAIRELRRDIQKYYRNTYAPKKSPSVTKGYNEKLHSTWTSDRVDLSSPSVIHGCDLLHSTWQNDCVDFASPSVL